MSRRRLMGGKEYKYIKDARDLSIIQVISDSKKQNAGALFNNYTSSSLKFEIHITVRVNSDDSSYGLVANTYNASNKWGLQTYNGYLRYSETYEGNTLNVDFTSLGKLEKGKWYTIDLYLPNAKEAYCKINSDTYTKFTTGTRRRMSLSNARAVYFGRNADYGVDLRGEILIKGFSSNGTTQNIGKWNIDDMDVGAYAGYMNGSGGSPSNLKLSGASNTVYLGRE